MVDRVEKESFLFSRDYLLYLVEPDILGGWLVINTLVL